MTQAFEPWKCWSHFFLQSAFGRCWVSIVSCHMVPYVATTNLKISSRAHSEYHVEFWSRSKGLGRGQGKERWVTPGGAATHCWGGRVDQMHMEMSPSQISQTQAQTASSVTFQTREKSESNSLCMCVHTWANKAQFFVFHWCINSQNTDIL